MFKKTLKIFVLFVSFVIVTGLFTYTTLNYIIKNEKTVVVPNLVGKNVISVLEILSGQGLNTKVKGSEYNSRFPENSVISQKPGPGSIIKKGRDVQIIFSKGTKTILMPELENESLSKALFIIEKSELKPGVISHINNNEKNKDTIIVTSPLAGTKIKKGSIVNILVSSGKKRIVHSMVDLKGKSITEALFILEKLKMKPGEIRTIYNEHLNKDTITSQSPLAGSRIIEGSRIDMVVNRKARLNTNAFSLGHTGVRLFKYKVDNGFLKKHIKIKVISDEGIEDIYNSSANPGEEILVFIPLYKTITLFLYENKKLIQTKIFD